MKKHIKSIFNRLGYDIAKYSPCTDSFYALQKMVKTVNSPVVFDVGAHHGQTALKFGRMIPNCLIHSFEPFPESYKILAENTLSKKNITVHEYGLGKSDATETFHSNKSTATNSLLATDTHAGIIWGENLLDTKQTMKLRFKKLDTVVKDLNIDRINILKLDVQGAEHLIMDGADNTLQHCKVDMIYSEIIVLPTYAGQLRFDKALINFYERGFHIHNIYNLSTTTDGRLRQTDVIFVRDGLSPQ